MRTPIKLSVIVPFYNEQDSIGALHAAIVNAVTPLQIPFEMVFVDDGSKDQTLARAVELAHQDHRIRVVRFRRNYGHSCARLKRAMMSSSAGDTIARINSFHAKCRQSSQTG